jgi:hypothetical protein
MATADPLESLSRKELFGMARHAGVQDIFSLSREELVAALQDLGTPENGEPVTDAANNTHLSETAPPTVRASRGARQTAQSSQSTRRGRIPGGIHGRSSPPSAWASVGDVLMLVRSRCESGAHTAEKLLATVWSRPGAGRPVLGWRHSHRLGMPSASGAADRNGQPAVRQPDAGPREATADDASAHLFIWSHSRLLAITVALLVVTAVSGSTALRLLRRRIENAAGMRFELSRGPWGLSLQVSYWRPRWWIASLNRLAFGSLTGLA